MYFNAHYETLSSPLSGRCVHQGSVPARRWLGQEEPVSHRGHAHAARLPDTHNTLQTRREQEESHQRYTITCSY